jgi:hypothetical protein
MVRSPKLARELALERHDSVEHMASLNDEILAVLDKKRFRNAYQIADRIGPAKLARYGRSGKGARKPHGAARAVADALRGMRDKVDVEYLNTSGLKFRIFEDEVEAGTRSCGLYRLKSNG